jgi:hypothetical protein
MLRIGAHEHDVCLQIMADMTVCLFELYFGIFKGLGHLFLGYKTQTAFLAL